MYKMQTTNDYNFHMSPTSSSICPQTLAMSSSLSVVLNRSSSTSTPKSLTKLDSGWCWDLSMAGEHDFSNDIFWTVGDCNFPVEALGDPAGILTDLGWPLGESLWPDLAATCCDAAWFGTVWLAGATDGVAEGLLRVRRPGVFCAVMFWYHMRKYTHGLDTHIVVGQKNQNF